MKPEDILFDLKQMTKANPWQGIGMWVFKNTVCRKRKISMRAWSGIMRYLVNHRKIEIFGPDQRIRLLLTNFQKNTDNEIRLDDNLIKDILSEISPCTPAEAYKYCVQKYGWCNPENFTRKMRKLAQEGEINRDDSNRYSIGKSKQKPVFAYTRR